MEMLFSEKSMNLIPEEITCAIKRALEEDIGSGDITTNSIFTVQDMMKGQIIAKQAGVIAGLDIVEATFKVVDEAVNFDSFVEEGANVNNQQPLAEITGHARALLTAERTALNFLGRMSGIATTTHQFIEAVAGTRAVILDTRKTAPGLRVVDKLAVKRGGGQNHRMGLFDMILIKDNHIDQAGSIKNAVERARKNAPDYEIEIEARTIDDVKIALDLGISRILLDNMSLSLMKQAVEITQGRAKLEASGNVNLHNVRQIAETGVDFISIGALTHSVKNFDVSLEWKKIE